MCFLSHNTALEENGTGRCLLGPPPKTHASKEWGCYPQERSSCAIIEVTKIAPRKKLYVARNAWKKGKFSYSTWFLTPSSIRKFRNAGDHGNIS